ncbi:transcriptional regulator, TetR family [Pseudosulfitobacter pseudonitzschiae]|uniref:TetR family transcriptional regulator n=2 Tax=Pseudosulfitobacter pseudonitzschiae TaxID=1402135 RepID=A0A073J406_9RHOB|nr:TetR/AcrR family transcriptional regulator [Pseudosulfitobacter pseudonitzschiae]KEJ96421.1 TetR family transcriptional regulator [Pseudosulfitobacter pseudonitzschiae]QKS08104.1 TetR/AcrR family transcriptional regulator [Pseudosulfitobacter pseudonitzschiae]SHF35376.1 transcriptional regulator, TetR family [Pseudosulfitobacter pseudonitzschiae]
MSQDKPNTRGRPPSKAARSKALKAAVEILMDLGFGRLTIDAVAARSGVGKPTIYRNWANASELAMAALMESQPTEPVQATGALSERLEHQVMSIVTAFATTRGRQIGLALAAADRDSEMTRAFRNRVILSGREIGRATISQAVKAGEIAAPRDTEVVLDMIYAPIFYRLLVGHLPLDRDFAAALVAQGLALLGAGDQRG